MAKCEAFMVTPLSGALALLLAVIVACSACGGGGGSGGEPASAVAPLVLVRWQESAGAAGYRVHWGTASNVYTRTVDVGNPDVGADGSVITVVELEAAADVYYLAVTAHDPDGRSSAFSNEIAVRAH
jgi:hypothetical protein